MAFAKGDAGIASLIAVAPFQLARKAAISKSTATGITMLEGVTDRPCRCGMPKIQETTVVVVAGDNPAGGG